MAHLDGLRMVALAGVLLFHFDMLGAQGGFVGVDAFFVLSGFLVTGIILKNLGIPRRLDKHEASFSIASFYKKRFWRLYPSSLATSAYTLVLAFLLFPRSLSAQVTESTLASMISVSNILFFSEAGYWDSS
jgi:peptidoglycan/LPS O-acetylase OafA/YrhL